MAQVNSSADPKPSVEDFLETFLAEQGKPLKIRVQPTLYDYNTRNYPSWQGVSWLLELEGVEEASRLREGLEDFFQCFGSEKQEQVLQVLQQVARG